MSTTLVVLALGWVGLCLMIDWWRYISRHPDEFFKKEVEEE